MKFQEFLDQVLPDKAAQATLQFFVGKDVPGSTIKFCGHRTTGKSTLSLIITEVFPQFSNRIDHSYEGRGLVNGIYFIHIIPANKMIQGLFKQIISNDSDAIKSWAKAGSEMTTGELSEIVLNSIIGDSK